MITLKCSITRVHDVYTPWLNGNCENSFKLVLYLLPSVRNFIIKKRGKIPFRSRPMISLRQNITKFMSTINYKHSLNVYLQMALLMRMIKFLQYPSILFYILSVREFLIIIFVTIENIHFPAKKGWWRNRMKILSSSIAFFFIQLYSAL